MYACCVTFGPLSGNIVVLMAERLRFTLALLDLALCQQMIVEE